MLVHTIVLALCATIVAGQAPIAEPPSPVDIQLPVDVPQAPGPAPDNLKRNGTCAFVYARARYYQVTAEATLQGSSNDTFVNDALIRLLRAQLQVAPCQLTMSQGEPCTSGTAALPCSDPVFQCGNGLTISQDVYTAVVQGTCQGPANNTLVCATIAANAAIPAAVATGTCEPACVTGNTTQASQQPPTSCSSYQITIDAPTLDAANQLATALTQATLATSVTSGLGGFAESNMAFLIVDAQVGPSVGFGFFPPPPSPPPPLKPISPPTSEVPQNATAESLAAAGVLAYGPWTACVPPCGDGFQTRTASCFAPDGTLLPLQECPGGDTAQTFQTCRHVAESLATAVPHGVICL